MRKLVQTCECLKQVYTNSSLQSYILKFAFKETHVKQTTISSSLQSNLIN